MAKKVVEINISGKKKNLKLGFNALIELEEALGKPLASFGEETPSLSDMRTIFHIALQHGGENKVTLEGAGEYIDDIIGENGIEYFSEKIAEVMQVSIGKNNLPSQ